MINGLSHLTFIVRDLEKSAALFREIFDADEVFAGRQRYLIIGTLWIALLEGEPTEKSYNHVAFQIDDDEFDFHVRRIQASGVEIKPSRERVEGEGRSLYFYDYDNHLFELHTGTLEQRLNFYAQRASKEKTG